MLEAIHVTERPSKLGEFGHAGDDHVVPFAVDVLDIRGRAVQLGPMLDAILSRHAYPEPVARLLAEACVLAVLLGTSLKFEGKFILQTRTDGPVDMLVADFSTPHALRGYARFDADRLQAAAVKAKDDPDAFLVFDDIFGDVGKSDLFRRRFAHALRTLWEKGTRQTLQLYLDGKLAE